MTLLATSSLPHYSRAALLDERTAAELDGPVCLHVQLVCPGRAGSAVKRVLLWTHTSIDSVANRSTFNPEFPNAGLVLSGSQRFICSLVLVRNPFLPSVWPPNLQEIARVYPMVCKFVCRFVPRNPVALLFTALLCHWKSLTAPAWIGTHLCMFNWLVYCLTP